MAMSTCVRCGKHGFEMKEAEPSNSRFKVMYIQCTSCGGVAGVTEYLNSGFELTQIKEALKQIASQVGAYVKL